MRKIKTMVMLLLSVVLVFLMSVSVSAVNADLDIEVATDKASYSATDVATFTVTVTNTGKKDIENISAEAIFEDLSPAGKGKSETAKEINVLESGESFSFSYKATLNKDEHKLNFFQKIILWFVRLFNGGYNANDNGFNNGRKSLTETNSVDFGKFSAENVVKVWYGSVAYLNSEDTSNMRKVSDSLKQLTEEIRNKELPEKVKLVKKQLSVLEKDGLIQKGSIEYDEDSKVFRFYYSCGISGSVLMEGKKEYSDPWLNPIGLTESNHSELAILKKQIIARKNSNINSNKNISSVLMYGFDEELYELSNDGSWISTERSFSEWTNLCNDKEEINTFIYDCPTVFDFKTALLDNDFICIFEHGIYDVLVENTYVFQIMGENVTESTDLAYNTDLYFERIGKFYDLDREEDCYYITPKFFEFYYKNKLNDAMIYLISCQGFGNNTAIDYGIAKTLTEICGAETVLGFHNSVAQCYAYAIYDEFTDFLISGMTVGEAFAATAYYNDSNNWENEVLYIGKHLINVNEAITKCSIKSGTLTIADYAFHWCRDLTSITIPDGMTSIGQATFLGCSSLKSITIPDSVTSIGESSFEYCYELKSITIENPNCTIYDNSNTISDTTTIYGYKGSTAEEYAIKYNRTFVALD